MKHTTVEPSWFV